MKKNLEHTSLLILALLESGDMYGYQMIVELERRSDHTFHMKEGTLYPVLKKLENAGAVTCYESSAAGRVRKYYHITPAGTTQLQEAKEMWRSYAHGIDMMLGFHPG